MATGGPDEADTCRDFVVPGILSSGWSDEQIGEQVAVLNDPHPQLPVTGLRRKRKADYVLELVPGVPLIVVEAKRLWARPGDGIQQATFYATKLDAPFALSTNGTGWVLYNAVTGKQSSVDTIPTPEEAWDLVCRSRTLGAEAQEYLAGSFDQTLRNADGSARALRYYQRRAIHEILVAKAAGSRRILTVMATGSGKTFTALQLVWKLVNHHRLRQRLDRELRDFRVLYLADRDILVGDPLRDFRTVFGDATARVLGPTTLSRDLYFATYQALSTPSGDTEPVSGEAIALLADYPPDFFDLVIIDECHRGSAREESTWRRILDHFAPAIHLGLTATPVNNSGADTYGYFGNPVFTYSLREGIEDGFLAPYTIRRVEFDTDADGVEVTEGTRDIHGQMIPAGIYGTRDFERRLRLPDRTRAMARRILDVIGDNDDRAVVFCVDAQHALTMCQELRNMRPELTRANPEWAARIMTAERDKDRLLAAFTDPESTVPQIAVTSSLLSTGVDIEDLKYVVMCRPINSPSEFKQIVGRGTRLYPEKHKYEFEIIDFVNATRLFRDPDFDGPPLRDPPPEIIDANGRTQSSTATAPTDDGSDDTNTGTTTVTVREPAAPFTPGGSSLPNAPRDVFELNGIVVTVANEGFYVHDLDSGRPRLIGYLDWARDAILDRFDDANGLLTAWADPEQRRSVVALLRNRRIEPERLAEELRIRVGTPVDTVDQLLQLAFDVPAVTRAERAREAVTKRQRELEAHSALARKVLQILLDVYAASGVDEIASAEVLRVPPLSDLGTPTTIAESFGGPAGWHAAQRAVQAWLYSA